MHVRRRDFNHLVRGEKKKGGEKKLHLSFAGEGGRRKENITSISHKSLLRRGRGKELESNIEV